MCSKQLLSTLIFAMLNSPIALAGDFAEFQNQFKFLEESIETQKTFTARYEKFRIAHTAMKKAKQAKPRADESAEISMTLVLDSFAEFPDGKITLAKCKKQLRVAEQMNRSHDQENEDPFFTRAKKVLRELCR